MRRGRLGSAGVWSTMLMLIRCVCDGWCSVTIWDGVCWHLSALGRVFGTWLCVCSGVFETYCGCVFELLGAFCVSSVSVSMSGWSDLIVVECVGGWLGRA